MILDPSDGNGVHAVVFRDPRKVRPQFRLEFLVDRFEAVFRAEYYVDMVADISWALFRPCGTRSFS